MKVQVLTENENSLGRGKKFYVGLFDFLTMFLSCVLLFVGFLAIFQSSASSKEMSDAIASAEKELADVCVETKLTRYESGESGTSLVSMERIAVDYVKSQVLARFIADSDGRANDAVFDGITAATTKNDPCYFYLATYKNEHSADYGKQTEYTVDYYKETVGKTECFDNADYPLIKASAADEIFAYYKDNSSSDVAYNSVKTAYENMVKGCVGDFMDVSNLYDAKQQAYGAASERLYKTYIYALLIAYLLSMTVWYLVLPLVLKDGQTVFMRLFRLRCVNYDEQNVGGGQVVVRFACQMVLYLFTPLLILLLSMDISTFSVVIFVRFLRFFNLFAVGTLAFLLTICNMVFTFYSKKKKQTISEFIAKLITVEDKRVKTVNLAGVNVEIK